jgi:hypothetical protein
MSKETKALIAMSLTLAVGIMVAGLLVTWALEQGSIVGTGGGIGPVNEVGNDAPESTE